MIKKCKRCKQTFEGSTECYYCTTCSTIVKRERVVQMKTCATCGASFLGYPRSKYCYFCSKERRKQRENLYKKNGPKRPLGSVAKCEACGADYVVAGGLQRYCKSCAEDVVGNHIRSHKKEYSKQYRIDRPEDRRNRKKDSRMCVICGCTFYSRTRAPACSPECYQAYLAIKHPKREISHPSGYYFITYKKANRKWQVSIHGKYFGIYKTVEEAKEAMLAAGFTPVPRKD